MEREREEEERDARDFKTVGLEDWIPSDFVLGEKRKGEKREREARQFSGLEVSRSFRDSTPLPSPGIPKSFISPAHRNGRGEGNIKTTRD